jgi:hypothetical protein
VDTSDADYEGREPRLPAKARSDTIGPPTWLTGAGNKRQPLRKETQAIKPDDPMKSDLETEEELYKWIINFGGDAAKLQFNDSNHLYQYVRWHNNNKKKDPSWQPPSIDVLRKAKAEYLESVNSTRARRGTLPYKPRPEIPDRQWNETSDDAEQTPTPSFGWSGQGIKRLQTEQSHDESYMNTISANNAPDID